MMEFNTGPPLGTRLIYIQTGHLINLHSALELRNLGGSESTALLNQDNTSLASSLFGRLFIIIFEGSD